MKTIRRAIRWFRCRAWRARRWLEELPNNVAYCAHGWINVLRYQRTGKASVICDYCGMVTTVGIGQVLATRNTYWVLCDACYADGQVHEHFYNLESEYEDTLQ